MFLTRSNFDGTKLQEFSALRSVAESCAELGFRRIWTIELIIFFSVGQGEVLTKEIPKDDEEIRITNGWSKGLVHG